MALAFFLIYFFCTLNKYQAMRMPWAEDLAIFNQAFWKPIHYGTFDITVRPYNHVLGMHFSPIMLLLLPLYALCPCPPTLFAISIFGLCTAGALIFLIADKITSSPWLALVWAWVFFISSPLVNLSTNGFRFVLLSVPFLALAIYFYLNKKFWPTMTALLLAAMCKEEVPLILIGFSIMAWLNGRELKWRLLPGLFGLSYFIIVISLVMPWFNRAGVLAGAGFETYYYLGANLKGVIWTLLTNPLIALRMVLRQHIFSFLAQLLLPVFCLPLLAPAWLLVPFSQFLVMFLAGYSYYASTEYWYFSPVYPFVFAAAAAGLLKIMNWFARKLGPSGARGIFALLVFTFSFFSPGLNNVQRCFQRLDTSSSEAYIAFAATIPEQASVTTQTPLTPYLSARRELCLVRRLPRTDYVILEFRADVWPLSREEYDAYLRQLADSGRYRLIKKIGDRLVLRRTEKRYYDQQLIDEIDTFFNVEQQ